MSRFFKDVASLSRKPQQQRQAETGTVPSPTTVPVPKLELVPPQTQALEQSLQTGTVPVATTVPVAGTVPVPPQPRTRVFRATRVEHGHTPGERLVLQALWTKASGNDRQRTIRIGYDRLANIASVNWKTARACLRSLEQKLAIETLEPENSNSREGRLYRIYGFDLILERRKQAGLEWVQKGRGVEFLQTGTVPLTGAVPPSTTVPLDGTGTPPDNGTDTVPASGGETVPATGSPLRTSKEENKETTTTAAPPELLVSLEALIPGIDAGAASRIWEECRQAIPDVTSAEVAYFFGKRLIFLPSKRVDNPTGLMIATVRDWITPRTVRERREALAEAEERRRQDEAGAAESMERLQAELALTRRG